MFGMDTHQWLAIFLFAVAAVMVIVVILREVLAARKEKRQFDNMIHHNESKFLIETFDPNEYKDGLYDWKKDGL